MREVTGIFLKNTSTSSQVVLVQLSKTSDEAVALSLYSVLGFFLERLNVLGTRK